MKHFISLFFFLNMLAFNLYAQDEDKAGGWYTTTIKFKFNEKWGGYAELQSRSMELTNRFYYHETKAGIAYRLHKNAEFLLGTGKYISYDKNKNFSNITSNEFRIWQQLVLNHDFSIFKLEHRYRIEQRYYPKAYRNRFRYRLSASAGINNRKIENNTLFINVYNEFFLNNENPHFERNRFYAGMGYRFSNAVAMQLGFVNQYDYSLTSSVFKNYFAVSLQFGFDFSKPDQTQNSGN